jgi:hypothetical protein
MPGSDAAAFYLLNSRTELGEREEGETIIVGVGPINVPEYLNRPQIVTRMSANELRLAEFHKWAEPLKNGIARVLAMNLAAALPVEVVFFPWRRTRIIDYQVAVQIERFDTDPEGRGTLGARWALFGRGGSQELVARAVRVTHEGEAVTYADRVATMSQVLADLSAAIVKTLEEYEERGEL